MSNLAGSNNFFNQQLIAGSSPSSVLWLFSPRNFSTQVKRPLMYKFGTNFLDEAREAVAQAMSGGKRAPLDRMLNNPSILSSVMPTADKTFQLDLSHLSNLWTFLLLVDNEPPPASRGVTSALSNNRTIYYGYCMDEPINPQHHFGRLTANEHASFVITHVTLINRNSTFGRFGADTRIDVTKDVDVIMPAHLSSMSSLHDNMYMIRPHDLTTYSATDSQGYTMSVLGEYKGIQAEGGPIRIDTELMLPRNNLRKILVAVNNAYDMVSSMPYTGTLDAEPNLGRDTLEEAITANLQSGNRYRFGLDEGQVITMKDIERRYNPQVEPVIQNQQQLYATADQGFISPGNIFASLMTNIIPTILTNCALASFSFQYNSYSGEMEIFEASSLLPLTDDEKSKRVNAVIVKLKQEVFPMIYNAREHFDLKGSFTSAGASNCVINFMCDSIKNTDLYEVPSILGGLNTNLVGGQSIANHNSSELANLISAINETGDRDVHDDIKKQQLSRPSLSFTPTFSINNNSNQPPISMPWSDPTKR